MIATNLHSLVVTLGRHDFQVLTSILLLGFLGRPQSLHLRQGHPVGTRKRASQATGRPRQSNFSRPAGWERVLHAIFDDDHIVLVPHFTGGLGGARGPSGRPRRDVVKGAQIERRLHLSANDDPLVFLGSALWLLASLVLVVVDSGASENVASQVAEHGDVI